jgi:CDGSH-type Zn-finger protein
MTEPVIASRTPYAVDVQKDQTYWWCSCGQSKNQPYCDGSHKPTSFTPVKFVAERSEKVWFCGCKKSAKTPFCDGTHNKL